jgi:hypothetical protein
MALPTFEPYNIGDKLYRTKKLPLREAFHLSLKLSPILAATKDADFYQIALSASNLPKATADDIFNTCLKYTQRAQGDNNAVWSEVITNQNAVMYEDISVADMLIIIQEVVKENLGGFFG